VYTAWNHGSGPSMRARDAIYRLVEMVTDGPQKLK